MSNLALHTIDLTVPDEALHALRSLGDICEEAILAGGCLRDTYFGVPFNDIDIFCSPDFSSLQLAAKMGPGWNIAEQWGASSSTTAAEYEEAFGIHMPAIWQMQESDAGHVVQFMVWPRVPTVLDLLTSFDFGFSQIACDGAATWVTDAFLADAANNTATFLHSADYKRLSRCHQRAERIGMRHPDRRWIWPPGAEPAPLVCGGDDDIAF